MHEKFGEVYLNLPWHIVAALSDSDIFPGPIVRINPRELHINDPHYYDHIYASGGKKRNKDPYFVGLFSTPLSMITTIDHDHHRFRREILSNFFSKKSVLNMTPLIQKKLAILMERFEQASEEGVVLDLTAAFSSQTGDCDPLHVWPKPQLSARGGFQE